MPVAKLSRMPIGERLRKAREAAGLTQDQAGAAVGVKKAAWSLWENNGRQPDPDQLVAICVKLGVSADWLLGLSERMKRRG